MPNKVTYTITTADGKEHQVSKENVDKYGIQSYADAYKGATIRMRDAQKGDYDIPLQHFDNARKQGLHAFSLEHTPIQKQTTPKATLTTSVSQPTQPASKPTTGGKPMTAAEKAQAMNFAAGIQQGVQRSKQQFDTTMQRAKAQQKNPLNVQRVTLGVGGTKPTMTANKRVVQGESKLNAQTGKLEPTYITEAGNVYQGDRTLADAEQNQIDDAKEAQLHPIDHELKEAYAERERLARELGRRGTDLDAEALEPSWRDIPHGSGGAIHTFNSATSNGRLADNEWKALSAAKNQNQQRIVALEAERDKAEAGFWRGITDTFKNPSFWSFGYTDMLDTFAMLNYGGKKTQRQKDADQAMIENTYKSQVVQSKYGNNRGFMYRAGEITAQAIPFMIEFAATGGLSGLTQAGTKAGAKIAEKVATKALTKKLIKYTGTTLGDVAAGVVMANTTGAARTASDIGQRHLGHVEQDEYGNYHFAGGEDWGTAIRKGEIAQGLEYYTEKLGAHLEGLPIGKTIAKGLDKIGLSKVTAALNRAGTSQYAQLGTKVMNRVGVNGYLNEVAEEEANIVLNSMLVGDNKMSDLFDGRTQADIWGGMLFSAGAMEAAPKLAGAVDYYRTKKSVKDADTIAAYRMTQEKWQPLRDQIDNATNEEMADVVNGIIQNSDLHEQEKKAALNYAGNLIKFRGFNTAQSTKAKELEETGAKDDETIIHQSMDNAYIQGHEASDEQKNDIKTRYEYAEQQLSEALGTEDVSGYSVDDFLDNKESLNDKQNQAAIDYLNAKSAYNGMISQVKDNIDDAIKASDVAIDNHTHEDGNIYPATMKVDNRKVYVVGGHAQMNDDGTGIDHAKASESIMVRDAETGKTEMVAPSAILSVDEATNAEEEKANAAESIRQTYAQQEANKIDGTLEFNVGDTYSVIGEDNSQHTLQVIGDAVDEKTGQLIPNMVMVSVDGSQQPTMLPKAQVQEMSDGENMLRLSQSLKQREEAKAAESQSSNTYSLNNEVTLTDESGNTVRGSITAPENEDGKFEVYTEQPINGKKVNLFSAEELDAITKAPETVAENATVQQPQQQEETEESVEKETPKQQPTALERIPKDESGQPLYEQAEPETAWDAIVEQTEGDTSMAQTVADDMVSDLEAGVKKAEKTKTKSGGSIAEKIAAEKERAAVIEQAKATLAHWRKIAAVNRMREAAIQAEEQRKADEVARVRKEQEEKERVEQEEAERVKREALNGVPDFVEDKATAARARGYRRVNGDKVDRQEPINATKGKEVQVKFDDDNIPTGHVAIIEANQLQPSHKNGQRNPQHFIDEAQPKERKDDASVGAARKIAANIRPEEITSSVTAYTGAPTVNSRGEVIQGNNRSAALREMWDNHQEQGDKYKKYLIDNAESFGLRAEDIAAMDKPVLVNMLDANDDEAISLGQFVASDTESGGTERIKPKNVVKKLGDKMKNFANILLRANDENISFAELVDSNGVDALKWLNANGVISPTQYKSAFDSKGNITAEAKNDIKGIMYQSIFEGGNTQLEEMFNALPAKAQKAILATAYRDYDSPQSERMIGDIQDSIMAYYALSHDSMFMNAKNHKDARIAVEAWRRQLAFDDVTGESYLPAEKYSNFALLLATMYKGDNQSLIQGTFNKMYDLIQGTQEETLFEQPDNTPRSLAQAIKETLNIEYNGQQGSNVLAGDNSASQEGRTGSNGDTTPRGRSENIDGAEANQGGTEGDTGRSGSGQSSGGSQEEVAEYSTVKTQGDVQTKKPTETEDFARQDLKELEDFQKNTDTTGRTTIDVDRYEAEDLFAPLLLDGKTSRLGVLTVVPDKITDPSGQIAVYDYSDEIDEKTNSGWQKWGDLTDEYNKTVDSSDKAQERGDTATLGFTSVDAALKFYDWLNTGGPKSANKVLEQSNEPMNADGHEYQENGSLQYSTEDLTNNTTAKRLATDTILSALNKAGIEVVRATDEQVQELLANTHATSLRTPQGTIYGWAVDGKIYLTEAGINPDTPIHEYTHLWAEAMMSKNKQGWNNIKTLLKGTSVWEEVVSDSNYSNITNNEDAVASEVLSRISGRENAARMESEAQKVIDEDKDVFEKAKSVTLLNRIKRALDMFWKWVGKELFKIKKFGSINEVTDRVLYDLMHSTKLNSNDKSLIGVHNISEQKLRKVLKQGGFANPSIAVIDTDKQVHNDYGEISLILPSRKINKSTGKNAGTFEDDAWTPMYPVVEKQISSDGRITIHNDINAVPKDMQSEVRNALNRWLENGSDTDLSYLYLFQQGKAPQMIVEKPKYSNEVHKTLNDIMFGVNSVYNLSKNEIKKLVELYIQTELDGNIKEYNEAIQRKISKYEELIKRGKPNSLRYRVADSYLEDIEKYGYPLSPLINFVNDVQRDKIKQGSKNAQKTLNTASQIIKDAGLEKDFKNWIEGLNNRYQTKEVIFDGFTPTGKRRYIPNTLENVSKIMKKQGRQASAGISISFSNFAAAVMKANGSLDNIRKKKSKLTNEHKDIEDFEEKWKEVYFDLAMKLQPNANMFDDYGFARLQEAANEKNPQTYIRNVYGITLSEEDVQKLQDLVEAIREERPALYFETKFERPVILNEFSKAVVPEDLSDDLKKTLRDNGVEVFTYKRGDIEERQKATQEAAYSSNDIAFQVIDNSRDSELIAINEQFNRELAELTEENAQSKRLKLGYPSPMLSAAGVPDKPIILYGNKLLKKAKLHNFDVKELHNLPLAMQNPIAVFEGSHPNSFATLLEIKLGGHNTLASIEVNKKGEADFNFISSLFGKESKGVTKWILDGKLLSVDKEKAQSYISASALNADATYKNELSSAAKIVKDFVNPVIQDENLLRDDTDTLSDIEYEDGNFSELTAEEPLFNVSSSIRSLIEGNLFSEVDFSDSPNKNVNQAISKLTDDKLLKEIAKGDSKEWNFYMEEYDRRHNKEFQEAVERYMNSLEDEKTSLDTAYGSYVNVAKNWSNGGYHTTERTLLRAQLDAIEDYVSKKESEQLSSVESEAYYQAKETVRKVGYDLTRLRLRPLEEGEACHVERRYTESNGFSFTGKEHVESIEDIAYIFKQLETSSVENSFLVLIKDGTPTVLHLSIGAYATTLAPIEQAIVAADAINPDKVLFVHNHPSGNISASKQDMDVQKKMKEIFGGKVMPAIIINTTSGKFGMFSEDGRLEDGNIPLPDEHNNIPINVYQFSQQVFAKDWNPEFAFRAVSPESIAEYVSSHRLGEHKKMSLIILDQAGHVTGNVFLPWTKLTDVDSHKNIMQIISYVNQMGGRSAILYGNYELGEDTRDTNKSIFKIKTAFSNSALHLMDVINIDDSALDRGAMEEDVEYGKRNLDEEKYREGYGSYTNSELSFINDPVAKMLGKSNRTEEDHKAFAERERQRMISRISELADKLHLDNIETVTDSNSLQGKKAKAKGFYSKSSGKITIVIPNHASVEDVEKTLLHEAVAHYGLKKLFGEHFETFLDNVYQNVEPEIRRIITSQAANNNWDFRTATEEYLAGLAERTDFERVHYAIWNKIKSLFLKMLHSIGLENWSATELSDNELRYLLWRSYENMKEPGRYRSILGEAEDVAKQNELKVGNYDQQDTNSSNVAERGILYREDDSKEKERVNAREQYEQRVNRAMFQTQEALQDSMLGLKEAMNAITKAEGKNVNIEDIDGYENAYLGENRLSSVNKAEADAFAHLLFKPMLAEVSKLCKNAQERAELVDYMMAKHGLERNAVMRKRAIEDILNNEKLSDAQKSARAGLAEYRDYAGLTALTGKDNVTEAEVDAEMIVSEYENAHDTTNLWDKVNAVNAAILSKSYECGMMDKDTYEKISDMYKYYIPLRGFDETTSEEAYAYLLHQSSAFNAPIKVAKGRSSKADDPFANMQSMAESAITQGNRNKLVKQRFFNFVLNHPSDLVSISDMWLKYDDVADEWKPVFPDNFEENDSAEDIEQKLKEFEDKMKKLAEQAPDKYKHGKETTNIPYRVVDSRDLHQHQVLVKHGGRDYILTLNGNPRAAQALNGQTNPDNDTSGAIGAILKAGEMVNRQLSAFYTTRNPDFVVSNFIRDMLFSNSIVWVKESPNYALRFHRNIARCNPAQIKVLLAKHRKGTLDMNNKLEHMFYQFMMNGGETGYANVRDIEQHKNDIRRELKRANGKLSITKAFNLLGEKLDEYNRAVENCARFAAYLTSREMGRTVERSIYDAKEISVNFNKKGSGAKFMNAVGQTKIGTASAFVSGIGRSGFVFWNAAIQGTTNFGRQFKKHPAKAFTASAIMFLLGAVIAGIGMGDGDDDADANSYWNLPEYVRRSNILFKIGDQWVSIPLPVEYRAIYGMGELMVSAMSGKEHFTGSELGKAIAGQATQVLPIDFLEGGGGVKAFVPSAVKPFAEVYSNKGWTGMPIYKDTPYNKYMPEWTKAYKSANKYLVGIAKTLNESTGGDAYTKGSVDINPAQIEYLLNGYFGGVSGTIDKLSKSAETIAGDREYDPRNFLLLNRILKNGDERTEARAINNEYMRVKEEHEVLKARMKHYENDTDKGLFDYADKIDFLYNSPEFARYEIFEDYSKDIDALYQELKEANDGAEHLSIEKELTELKKEMIEEMNKTRK